MEARLCIDEISTRDQYALLDQIRRGAVAAGAREDFRFRRWPARRRLLGSHPLVNHAEVALGLPGDDYLKLLARVVAGDLDHDTVDALALNRWLDRAELVDTLLHHWNRLLDRLAHAREERRLRHRDLDTPAAEMRNVQRMLAGRAGNASKRPGELS